MSRRPMTAGSRVWVSGDGALQVQAVRASDAGEYTCVVTSPGGNHTRRAQLSVIELPFSPTNVRAERLDATSQRAVNVSWTPGFDGNSPVHKYIVQRRIVPEFGLYITNNIIEAYVCNSFISTELIWLKFGLSHMINFVSRQNPRFRRI